MNLAGYFGLVAVFVASVDFVSAWDQEEFEIFDLVEEINQNFYTVLKVEQVIPFYWHIYCKMVQKYDGQSF